MSRTSRAWTTDIGFGVRNVFEKGTDLVRELRGPIATVSITEARDAVRLEVVEPDALDNMNADTARELVRHLQAALRQVE